MNMSEIQDKSKMSRYKITFALLGILLLVVYVSVVIQRLSHERTVMSAAQLNDKKSTEGNVNGVNLIIPKNYQYFPVEYKDQSIWEKSTKANNSHEERTCKDDIQAFTVYAHWPDMGPRDNQTLNKYKSDIPSWLLVAVTARGVETKGIEYGFSTRLNKALDRFSKETLKKYPIEMIDPTGADRRRYINVDDIRYVQRGIDSVSGLQWAVPEGSGVERFYTWNMALYWSIDTSGTVTDFIECYNGRLPNPDDYHICNHSYEISDWGAYVTVTYTRDMLSQWKAIKERTSQTIYRFRDVNNACGVAANKQQGEM